MNNVKLRKVIRCVPFNLQFLIQLRMKFEKWKEIMQIIDKSCDQLSSWSVDLQTHLPFTDVIIWICVIYFRCVRDDRTERLQLFNLSFCFVNNNNAILFLSNLINQNVRTQCEWNGAQKEKLDYYSLPTQWHHSITIVTKWLHSN